MKLKELNDESILKLIKICAKFSGVTNTIQQDDFYVVSKLMRDKFYNLDVDYFQDAFVTFSQGELGKIEHFGSFTPKFVGEIIREFKEYKRKKNLIVQLRIEPEKLIEHKPLDPEAEDEKAFLMAKKQIESDDPLMFCDWSGAFRHAEKHGLIKMSNEDKKTYLKKIKSIMIEEIDVRGKSVQSVRALVKKGISTKEAQIEARRRLLIDYFKNKV